LTGNAPLSVAFTDDSLPGSSAITAWAWDFGDGGTSTDANPTHEYTTEGTYTVALTVTTAAGSDTETKTDYITVEAGTGEEPITLDQGLSSVTIEEGATQNVAFTVNLTVDDASTNSVTFEQALVPDDGGVTWTSDYPGGWSSDVSQTWLVNETLTGVTVGSYVLTSTVTITETGDTDTATLAIEVVPAGAPESMTLNPPGADPDGIEVDIPTEVIFTVLLTGTEAPPDTLAVEEVDATGETLIEELGTLADDGLDADLAAGDLVFSGAFTITGNAVGAKYYQAVGVNNAGTFVSDLYALTVTSLPVGPAVSNPGDVVVEKATGDSIFASEVLVKFVDGTSEARIEEIAAAEGAQVAGTLPSLGVVQLWFTGDGTAAGVLAMIAALETYGEVEYAEANGLDVEDAFTPNDPSFASQTNMTVVRADEAWVVGKGTLMIAVVDTGVDYNHDDLKNKVIKGKDFVAGDNDPMDAGTHGTHVAGIAAAESNNGKSVAGVAWNSKILAVRGIGSHAAFAAAVRYAADQGAKVINYSGGGSNSATKHNAVKYAVNKGALFVTAAGNDGGNIRMYPAAYDEVLCVGNSTDADGRAASSSYGTWVDIAAPGVGVTSTVPGNTTGVKTGTSMSSPLVAGAAAMVWSAHPSWTAAKVRERLIKSGKKISAALLIGGSRLDVYEAVFNGSFEIGDLSEWTAVGTASSLLTLGPFTPQHEKRMGYVSTGPAGDQVAGSLSKTFTIQAGVTSIPLSFEYNFITEEYPEWVGTQYDDILNVTLVTPDGSTRTLATESVNASSFSAIGGLDFPGGDSTVGHTGWKTVNTTVPVTQGAGSYSINITDTGDDIYDSVVLVDHIRMK